MDISNLCSCIWIFLHKILKVVLKISENFSDKETGEIAIQAGQTGHYVLSTIHTIDSIEVITRLRKMGLSDYDISSTLATTISQRLVRRLCPKCRKDFERFMRNENTN